MTTATGKPDDGRSPSEGPECRKCGCRHLPVQHTSRAGKKIIRYRRCRHCGTTMTTTERVSGE